MLAILTSRHPDNLHYEITEDLTSSYICAQERADRVCVGVLHFREW